MFCSLKQKQDETTLILKKYPEGVLSHIYQIHNFYWISSLPSYKK